MNFCLNTSVETIQALSKTTFPFLLAWESCWTVKLLVTWHTMMLMWCNDKWVHPSWSFQAVILQNIQCCHNINSQWIATNLFFLYIVWPKYAFFVLSLNMLLNNSHVAIDLYTMMFIWYHCDATWYWLGLGIMKTILYFIPHKLRFAMCHCNKAQIARCWMPISALGTTHWEALNSRSLGDNVY